MITVAQLQQNIAYNGGVYATSNSAEIALAQQNPSLFSVVDSGTISDLGEIYVIQAAGTAPRWVIDEVGALQITPPQAGSSGQGQQGAGTGSGSGSGTGSGDGSPGPDGGYSDLVKIAVVAGIVLVIVALTKK